MSRLEELYEAFLAADVTRAEADLKEVKAARALEAARANAHKARAASDAAMEAWRAASSAARPHTKEQSNV